jgi:hypothetical protein
LIGQTDVSELFRKISASLAEGIYVFVSLPDREIPEGLSARMIFEEEEGTTLILLKRDAESHALTYEFPCRMITLNVHSSLEAVGFMARIADALSKEGMSVNPVAAFFHDHIFVPDGRQEDALRVLHRLSRTAAQDA